MNGPDLAVRVRALEVERGGKMILPGVDLDMARGRVIGLLGPSGCGKTTLMRAIVGVQVVHAGSVEVLGLPAGDRRLRRKVAYVTQAPSVYGDLTGKENLRYFGSVLGTDEARSGEVTEMVGLADVADRVVGRLSGGQRARVSLATALLGEPDLLVLDEPTVGLDPLLRNELWGTFRRLADDGATLLVSSHVMDEASRCDQLVLMRDGRILASEEPAALIRQTGADDVEGAFLALVGADGSEGAS